MSAATHPQSPPVVRDAATVLVLRDAAPGLEVLLLRRHRGIVFGGGADVFPGGALDPEDADPRSAAYCGVSGAADAVWRVAALRECFEEAGLLLVGPAERTDAAALRAARSALQAGRLSWADVLDRLGVRPGADGLREVASWTTPAGAPKRYATRFYATSAPAGQSPHPDGREIVRAEWVSPATALADASAGARFLMTPTRVMLGRLARYARAADALAGLVAARNDG